MGQFRGWSGRIGSRMGKDGTPTRLPLFYRSAKRWCLMPFMTCTERAMRCACCSLLASQQSAASTACTSAPLLPLPCLPAASSMSSPHPCPNTLLVRAARSTGFPLCAGWLPSCSQGTATTTSAPPPPLFPTSFSHPNKGGIDIIFSMEPDPAEDLKHVRPAAPPRPACPQSPPACASPASADSPLPPPNTHTTTTTTTTHPPTHPPTCRSRRPRPSSSAALFRCWRRRGHPTRHAHVAMVLAVGVWMWMCT